MPLPRRKKPFTMDGAEFILSPLTYDQLEEYLERAKATAEKLEQLKLKPEDKIPEELANERTANAFFVIRCGLSTPDTLSDEVIRAEIDDTLGARLVREILTLNGYTFTDQKEKVSEGETPASS